MAFPDEPLDVTVELFIDGSWVDITNDVLVRDGISISRGRRDEGSRTDPARCSMSINNESGKYSPRNPTSPYYGKLGRNTPIRVLVGSESRFVGEVSSWPSRWDVSGTDVWVPIEASGILRRLGQGAAVIGSPMYRGRLFDTEGLVAYWPMEDEKGASSLASGLSHAPMSIVGNPELAGFDGFVSSKPIPVLKGAEFRGSVPTYTVTGETQVRFLMSVPSGGAESGQTLLLFYTTGSASRWEFYYQSGGLIGLRAFNADNTQLHDTAASAFGVNGKLLMVSLELTQSGPNIGWRISTAEPGESGLSLNGTFNGNTVGRVGTVVVSPSGGVQDVAIGHLSVQNVVTDLFDLVNQLNAWNGERAGRRIERLCAEEGVEFTGIGDLDDTVPLGYQGQSTMLDLIYEAAESDMGHLFETRDELGITYRTQASLLNQSAAVALDYEAGHLAPPLEPIDDDQSTRNDITATRDGGSSYRAVRDSGPLSVQPPPDGVGRYDEEVTVSVQHDVLLADHAHWRLHMGTVDETRYPTITLNLASSEVSSDSVLTADVIDMEIGDRVTIENPPEWIPPGTISQLVLGYSETIGPFEWTLTLNCAPESPYQVAVYGTSRYSTDYSVLASSENTTDTSISVTTSTGPIWTTNSNHFPLDIVVGGEVMRVTGISGSSSTQTFMVIRSINGVVKSHSAGTPVRLLSLPVRSM